MQNQQGHASDASSTTSTHRKSQGKTEIPLVKQHQKKFAILIEPRGDEPKEKISLFRNQSDENLLLKHNSNAFLRDTLDTFTVEDDSRHTYLQAESLDLKTHFYALQRGCNCNPHCTGRCRHQVYFVYKIARVYNGHIVKSFESDRMRKADKDIPSGPTGLKNDRVAAASEIVLGGMKKNSFKEALEEQYKSIEKGFKGDLEEKATRRGQKREAPEEAENDGDVDEEIAVDVEEDGDFAKYSDDSDVHEMEKQPVENDQWNNPYPLVDDDDFSKKESKDDGEKETESSDSSESDISLDTEDSEEKTAEAAQPEDDMAEQMKSLFQDLFTRNGNRIQIDQINVLVMRELNKRLELGKWYQRNAAKAAEIFQSLSRRNDGTGFYDYRG